MAALLRLEKYSRRFGAKTMIEPTIPKHGASPKTRGVGYGEAIGHHGEFLQGVFKTPEGRLQRGLLTVPHPQLKSVVNFWPRKGDEIRTRPESRGKAATAARLTLDFLGQHGAGGDLTIQSNIRLGSGLGSSTADVVASIRATADAYGKRLARLDLCNLAVQAELASDAIAFDMQPVLFAHREAKLIEAFPGDFPDLLVVGFDTGDDPISTTEFKPARYTSAEIELFSVLRSLVSRAVADRDTTLFCRVATMSSNINQSYLPRARYDEVVWLAEECDAKGIQIAHSGNVAGFLFDAGNQAGAALAMRSLRRARFDNVGAFHFPSGREIMNDV